MLNRILKTVILGVFTLTISTIFTSCQKAKDTIGVIVVKDGSGNPVSQARVVLHSNPLKQMLYSYNPDNYTGSSLDILVKSNMETTYSNLGQHSDVFEADWTDDNGRAEFTLPLAMTLNVSVLKIDGNDKYLGANIINIKKEETTTQTINLINY